MKIFDRNLLVSLHKPMLIKATGETTVHIPAQAQRPISVRRSPRLESALQFVIIIAAILATLFIIGCTQSRSPIPVITFQHYITGINGTKWATFKAENPTQNIMVCQVHIESENAGRMAIVQIPEEGSCTFTLQVFPGSKPSALSVTLLRFVPDRQFAVTMPDIVLESTGTNF
jgi:hypothetical protein